MSKSHLLPIFSPLPVCFQKGEGVWLTDTQGNVYLDGFAGIAVNAVGHNHPRLVSALQKQVSELIKKRHARVLLLQFRPGSQ